MPGSINNISTIQNNYSEEAIQNELIQTQETEETERQSPLQNPTNDPTQTALIATQNMQTALTIAGSQSIIPSGSSDNTSGKNLNQIVIEKNASQLSALSTQSTIGSTAEVNALPPEIQTRNDIE